MLYSTEDCDTASFKKIGATITVPGQWKQYTATLPADTRHFAIRCVSQDQYILFLDDITYRKAARDFSLLGYNVYRGNELLTTAPIPATAYTDNAGTEDAVYSVSAVYNTGESRHAPFGATRLPSQHRRSTRTHRPTPFTTSPDAASLRRTPARACSS